MRKILSFIFTAVFLAVSPFAAAHQGNISDDEWTEENSKRHAEQVVPYPLNHAAFHGDLPEINRLIATGADVDAKGNDGWTALHYTGFHGQVEGARLLLEKGADINAKDNDGWTALHFAAYNNRIEAAQLLLEKGADINAKTDDGLTALDLALLKKDEDGTDKYPEMVKLLKSHGAK